MHYHQASIAVFIGLVLSLAGCGDGTVSVAEAPDQWRATDTMLADRVEHLAQAGEAEAATGVFSALVARPNVGGAPAEQRARLALARSLIGLGRNDDALVHLQRIVWADKSPAIASQILGLEAKLRWQQLTVHGEVVSGAIPSIAAADAPQGEPSGPWLSRRESYTALADVLDRGVRLVHAEGGTPEFPASAEQMVLARFAFGDRTLAVLSAELGDPGTWQPAVALAVVRVHVAEHDIDHAAEIATV